MSRESCISHQPKQALAIVRQDYYELTGRDACAAALLNIFEYWANAAIATDPAIERPWVGAHPIREFEQMLLGIATDKQIRKRLALLEEYGFIRTKAPIRRGSAKEYQVLVPEIQRALFGQMTEQAAAHRSNAQCDFGQITDDEERLWSNDRAIVGQMTNASSVKQPKRCRLFDRALKKKPKELKKERSKEDNFVWSNSSQGHLNQSHLELSREQSPIQIGTVLYTQQPETIDLSELWVTNPGMAKMQLRALSSGHKRLDMVAHGLGQWWVGPGLNDFDEFLIKACQNRKRKLQQSNSIGDAKTFINNMIRNGDWGNLSLRCEEAKQLREREQEAAIEPQVTSVITGARSPFVRSEDECRESALGLARYKISQKLMEQALAIALQFGFSNADIGLSDDGIPSVQAA